MKLRALGSRVVLPEGTVLCQEELPCESLYLLEVRNDQRSRNRSRTTVPVLRREGYGV